LGLKIQFCDGLQKEMPLGETSKSVKYLGSCGWPAGSSAIGELPNSKNFHFVSEDVVVYIPGLSSPTQNSSERSKFPNSPSKLSCKQTRESANEFDIVLPITDSQKDMDMILLNTPG